MKKAKDRTRSDHQLILFDDSFHTEQHFAAAIKKVFGYADDVVRLMCKIIHRQGSCTCILGNVERLEHIQSRLERLGLRCQLEESP